MRNLHNLAIWTLLTFILSGCSASIGTYERGLWFDSDAKEYQPKGAGIKLDLIAGMCVRPIPKLSGENCWDDPWFVLKFPIIGPFISAAWGESGFYLGFKSFKNHKGRYDWLPTDAPAEKPQILYTLSATTRRTRWK